MSSNIRITRICLHCNCQFEARTTVTKYCSDNCAKRAYKIRKREEKITTSNIATEKIILKPLETIKGKEFLTIRDIAILLNCSVRTVYRLVNRGNIKAINISQRKTLVKRTEIDKLFE